MGDTRTLHISAQHPAFEGHFPGTPLLPGVVLLDEMLHALEPQPPLGIPSPPGTPSLSARSSLTARSQRWTVSTAKFLHPVRPGDTLTLEHEQLASGAVRFTIRSADHPVATGLLVPLVASAEPDHGNQTR